MEKPATRKKDGQLVQRNILCAVMDNASAAE